MAGFAFDIYDTVGEKEVGPEFIFASCPEQFHQPVIDQLRVGHVPHPGPDNVQRRTTLDRQLTADVTPIPGQRPGRVVVECARIGNAAGPGPGIGQRAADAVRAVPGPCRAVTIRDCAGIAGQGGGDPDYGRPDQGDGGVR